MALTRNFRETVQARALEDTEFRDGLLTESLEAMLSGDVATGKSLLRDYINATTGFEPLAEATKKSAKSIMRMLSDDGNPQAENLFMIISTLQQQGGLQLEVTAAHHS